MDEYQGEPVIEGKYSFVKSSQFKNLLASSLPTFLMRPIVQPLEVLKIRFQLQHQNFSNLNSSTIVPGEPYHSIFHAIKVIYHEEGWRALFRGLVYSQCVSVTSSIMQFSIYRNLRVILHQSRMTDSPEWCDFLAGFITGAVSAVLLNPFDLIRTHLISRERDHKIGLLQITKGVYNSGGITRFYSGALTALWHAGTLNGLRFMFYNISCRVAMKYEGVHTHGDLKSIELLLSGIAAGSTANAIAYPIEFIKRRLQSDKSRAKLTAASLPRKLTQTSDLCFAIIQCATSVVKSEGINAVYKGFLPNALKSILSTAIQFSCYDIIYHWVDVSFR